MSQLLLDIAAGRKVEEARLSDPALNLAHRHGLVGLIASDLRADRRAAASFTRLRSRQSVMLTHLARLLEAFEESGIPAAILKGSDLASRVYRNPAHRTFTDVDVLVPPEHLQRALDLLDGDPAVPHIPAQGPKADKRNIPMVDASGVRFTLDLHWDLFSYTQLHGAADGATESAWRLANRSTDSAPAWQLPEPAMICFLCTHALLDHRFRLILFRDLTEVALRGPDWEEVGRFAHRFGLRSSTYIALLMAARVTDAAVPADFLESLRPRTVPVVMTERLLPRTDLVRFDGHQPHPLSLAIVLLHDSPMRRVQLAANAVVAFPDWKRRVRLGARRKRPRVGRDKSIVVLVTTDRRRGAEVFGERLAKGLGERGWDVALMSLSHDPSGPRVKADVIKNAAPETLGRLEIGVVRDLRKAFQQRGTRIVLANGSSTLQYALAASRTLRRPIRVMYASIGEPLYWIRGRGRRLVQRALLAQTDLVVAVSEATKLQLVASVGVSADKVAVAPTGVPDYFFEISKGGEHAELRLLFLGNLSREKGPAAALALLRRLPDTVPAKLRFVGEGPLQPTLQAEVGQLNLADSVSFVGSVEEVAPHLQWADLLVLTSETEGLPGVVMEAAAAGVPAVAYNVGGAAETIREDVTGVLVPPGDVDSMVRAVMELARDRESLRRMGNQARAFMAEKYTLDRAVDCYHQLLMEQLNGQRREPLSASVKRPRLN